MSAVVRALASSSPLVLAVALAVGCAPCLASTEGGARVVGRVLRSRLPGEPLAGVDDRHVHPVVPRTLRLATTLAF